AVGGIEPGAVEVRSRDLIVCLADELTAPASVLARADGRPLLSLPDVVALPTSGWLSQASSVLVIGRPSQLRNRMLLDLSARLHLPWGVLTARDAPALSFAIAKVLAARRPSRASSGHLDAIARRHWERAQGAIDYTEAEFDAETTWPVLHDGEWQTLSIHCHGDGAHANFNSVVLCGVADTSERAVDGHSSGCVYDGETTRCKRVHGHERRPFRFGDLQARRMCLFTCNGFSVAGDVYPSDSSFMLSAAEGFPAAVLTTDRRLRFDPWLFPAVHSMLNRESLAMVGTRLNDLCTFTDGARPYLLYGDPSALAEPHPGRVSPASEAHRTHVVRLGRVANAAAVGFADESDRATIVRGETLALITGDGASPVPLVDRSDAVDRFRQWLIDLSLRAGRATQLEAAIPEYADLGSCGDVSSLTAARDELWRISRRLEIGITEGTRLLAEIGRTGVWQPAVRTWQAHMRLLIHMWDHQLAALILDDLMDRHLSELLREGFPRTDRSTGPPCPRCGCAVLQGTASPLLPQHVVHMWMDCPTCGPREAWDDGAPRLSARPPAAIRAGSSMEICLEWTPTADTPPLDGSDNGFLIVHLKDSGLGCVSFRGIQRATPPRQALTIPIADNCAPEIHTLRLAFVSGLSVSYLRLRAPAPAE